MLLFLLYILSINSSPRNTSLFPLICNNFSANLLPFACFLYCSIFRLHCYFYFCSNLAISFLFAVKFCRIKIIYILSDNSWRRNILANIFFVVFPFVTRIFQWLSGYAVPLRLSQFTV